MSNVHGLVVHLFSYLQLDVNVSGVGCVIPAESVDAREEVVSTKTCHSLLGFSSLPAGQRALHHTVRSVGSLFSPSARRSFL